jgi:hypothetical protein
VNKAAKKCRAFSATAVVAIALSFGLLSSAQCTRTLSALSSPRACSFANPRLGLTRHAVKEVSPSKPELPAMSPSVVPCLLDADTPPAFPAPAVGEAELWPESGWIQHRQIPSRSADDPKPL